MVDIDSGRQQVAHDIDMPMMSGRDQGRTAIAVDTAKIGARRDGPTRPQTRHVTRNVATVRHMTRDRSRNFSDEAGIDVRQQRPSDPAGASIPFSDRPLELLQAMPLSHGWLGREGAVSYKGACRTLGLPIFPP